MYAYIAFKHGKFLSALSGWGWSDAFGSDTFVHTAMLFEVPCRGPMCSYCNQSQRETRSSQPHFLTYYGTTGTPWACDVDSRKFLRYPHDWTYLAIPMRDIERAHAFIRAQVGKPLNMKGFYLNYLFGTRYGVSQVDQLDTSQAKHNPSWLCCELFITVLVDQGYGYAMRHLVPCQTWPVELWMAAKNITGAEVLHSHPSITRHGVPARDWDAPPKRVTAPKHIVSERVSRGSV